jgi:hypothetical protein
MHGVLGWQVGPVPGADTAALEGATVFLKPAEHYNIDCRFSVECKMVTGKIQAFFIGKLVKNQKKVCCKTVRFVPGSN